VNCPYYASPNFIVNATHASGVGTGYTWLRMTSSDHCDELPDIRKGEKCPLFIE
jgi:hypothetical protein